MKGTWTQNDEKMFLSMLVSVDILLWTDKIMKHVNQNRPTEIIKNQLFLLSAMRC